MHRAKSKMDIANTEGEGTLVDCANCRKILEREMDIVKEISFVASEEYSSGSSNIQIIDALATIYDIQWSKLFIHLNQEEVQQKGKEETSSKVVLCGQCSALLSQFYKSYVEFEKFCKFDSLIKKAKDFRFQFSENSFLLGKGFPCNRDQEDNGEIYNTFNFNTDEHSDEEETEIKYDPLESTGYENRTSGTPETVVTESAQVTRSSSLANIKLENISEETIKSEESPKIKIIGSKVFLPPIPSEKEMKRREFQLQYRLKHLTCPICSKVVKSQRYMENHIRAHSANDPTECEICGKVFSCRPYMKRHLRNHKKEGAVNCEICGKRLASKEELRRHKMRGHISDGEKIC